MATSPEQGRLRYDHGELAFARVGAGPCVIALHGLPGTRRDYARFGQVLAARGLSVLALDLPGFGESSPPAAPSWEAVACAVEAAVRSVGGPVALLAHSFGSHVALRVAAQNTAVRALGLLAPAGLRRHRAVRSLGPAPVIALMAKSGLGRAAFHAGLARTGIGKGTPRASSDLALSLLASADFERAARDAQSLRVPVLAARADDDRMVEASIVDELVAAIPGARALAFSDGGHGPQRPHAEAIAEALAALVHAAM